MSEHPPRRNEARSVQVGETDLGEEQIKALPLHIKWLYLISNIL